MRMLTSKGTTRMPCEHMFWMGSPAILAPFWAGFCGTNWRTVSRLLVSLWITKKRDPQGSSKPVSPTTMTRWFPQWGSALLTDPEITGYRCTVYLCMCVWVVVPGRPEPCSICTELSRRAAVFNASTNSRLPLQHAERRRAESCCMVKNRAHLCPLYWRWCCGGL